MGRAAFGRGPRGGRDLWRCRVEHRCIPRVAEHGVGMTKKPYLQYSRSETEIEYLREVKKVFDPNNIMNRGKIFDM